MKLEKEEIKQISTLSRLEIGEEKQKMYSEQLSTVFGYIKMLEEVDTDGVKETTQVTGLEDVVRDDIVIESSEEKRQKLIALFPKKSGDLLKVDAVFVDAE